MMYNILILAVVVVSVSAQFEDNRRFNGERGNLRINSQQLRVNEDHGNSQDYPTQGNSESSNTGGFQNGNFARTDGRLRTNLNSGQNNFRPREATYVVEGAAFNRQDERQFDVHSTQGRVGDISQLAAEENIYENGRSNQNFEIKQNGERGQSDQRNYNSNVRDTEQSRIRNSNTNENRFGNQNTQDINSQAKERGQNTDYNVQNGDTSDQNTREINNQGRGTSEANLEHNNKRTTNMDSKVRAIVEKVSKTQLNYDREAYEREINNQITKMIFEESTVPQEKNKTKPTQDNEVPTRSSLGKKDDRWIWSDDTKNMTTTIVPTVDDRAAFAGDQCPTGQVKFNKVCVEIDED